MKLIITLEKYSKSDDSTTIDEFLSSLFPLELVTIAIGAGIGLVAVVSLVKIGRSRKRNRKRR